MKRSVGFAWMTIAAVSLGSLMLPSLQASPFSSKKSKHSRDEDVEDFDEFDVKLRVPLVGEYTTVYGQERIKLLGAGLVTGLDGTGEDPPPSPVRQMVLDDMKRRGIPNPNKVLKSPNIAVVIVTAYVPPLIRKGDTFDVEVRVPDGSKARSLNGGWLLPTYLSEHAFVPGQGWLQGHQYATAKGPILITAAPDKSGAKTGLLRRGVIVTGGTWIFKTDRNLSLFLRSGFRSERNAIRIASAIGQRFYEYDKHGERLPLAEAKTNQKIELKVLTKYRDNYPRYLDVIRRIAFRESDTARQLRIGRLKQELLNPEMASQASLSLEAIGDKAVPALKSGLKSKDAEVRFHSAVTLAYLGDASGLDVLVDSARNEYAFRVFALAAMSCLEDAEVPVKLRELMDETSAETRYGAFRALTTLDQNDPFVKGRRINDQFQLHVLPTEGPPMVHITNCRKAEVVLFGADQQIITPIFARAGTRILVTTPGSGKTLTVSRFDLGRADQHKVVSRRLADVIGAIADLGASFPDVVQFLSEADSQKNLPGRLEIDALPQAGRYYVRKGGVADEKSLAEKKRVRAMNMAPNLFSTEKDATSAPTKTRDAEAPADSATDEVRASKRHKRSADSQDFAKLPPKDDSDTGVTTAGLKTASDEKASVGAAADDAEAPSASKIQPVGHEAPAAGKGKSANDDNELNQTPPPQAPPASGFSFWRLFDFGSRAPAGNKEP